MGRERAGRLGGSVMDAGFVLSQFCKVGALAGIAFACGVLVRRFGVLVNYTRKINHFSLFCVPQLLDVLFGVTPGLASGVVNGVATVAMFGLFWRPVRARLPWAQ